MTYAIYEVGNPKKAIDAIHATSEVEALAFYAVYEGYADPREVEMHSEERFFSQQFDGTWTMTYENTELVAVPV